MLWLGILLNPITKYVFSVYILHDMSLALFFFFCFVLFVYLFKKKKKGEQQQKYICFSINVFLMTAMSATPGQNETSIQKLINNLKISRLEVRSENDLDIKKYRHETKEECFVLCAMYMNNDCYMYTYIMCVHDILETTERGLMAFDPCGLCNVLDYQIGRADRKEAAYIVSSESVSLEKPVHYHTLCDQFLYERLSKKGWTIQPGAGLSLQTHKKKKKKK
ncbi:ATP-dependent DNA helicase [Reticulomyxa filosa]|uniref:ATP-dependent DNA helicase n=1 Tax=Reticulomyxa filosa TaxID=46433 RepID=X6NVB2_RETFI|nr:ATP-dependent DNA helicase [Reticulomyxa filosa]|eukprot:ETO29222.1 ATP-dependent DNA helicase [Reticulomyxa filosa]